MSINYLRVKSNNLLALILSSQTCTLWEIDGFEEEKEEEVRTDKEAVRVALS